MNYSDLNTDLWRPIIVIGIISALTLLANILRSKVSFIKKTYVPTAVLAGFTNGMIYVTGLNIGGLGIIGKIIAKKFYLVFSNFSISSRMLTR